MLCLRPFSLTFEGLISRHDVNHLESFLHLYQMKAIPILGKLG